MQLKLNLGDLSESNHLKSIQKVTHSGLTDEEIKYYFSFMLENELIKASSFDDNIWLFPDEHKDRDIVFRFDIELYPELKLALKGYILLKRISGRAISSCHSILQNLKRVIMHSQGFKNAEGFESYLLRQTPLVAYSHSSITRLFLSFYEHPNKEKILEICSNIITPDRNNRELPFFPDVLLFDEYLTNYYKQTFTEQHIRFYPMYIWWKLTNIVPLRVVEFLAIKKDCLEPRNHDNSYWIRLPREKRKADSPFKIDITDEVQINKEVYDIVSRYIQIIENEGIETPYLLPYDLYVKFLPFPHRSSRQRKGKRNKLIDKYLQRIIDDFYELVIKEQEIDRVSCGDTRHFAMMNMFLQGFNMLSIARMAGHDKLETQFNYYSHIDHYVQSQVYILAQKKFEDILDLEFRNRLNRTTRNSYDKGLIYEESDLSTFRKVDYGYCSDNNFPNNCVEDCRVCNPYYIFKPAINEVDEAVSWLTSYSYSYRQKIKEITELMYKVNESMFYDIKKLYSQKSSQSKLNSSSAQLTRLMDQQATIEARIMRYQYD